MKRKKRSKSAYDRLRKQCYDRDEGLCVMCGRPGTDSHHIVFRSQGGKDELTNLATLCRYCHEQAHGRRKSVFTQREIRENLLQYAGEVSEGS
ncbi:MAG: HNH endonuclease [Veillonellaceae bacterium]|nr:HNH endonuclease [Veillonellaceae bacterium]